jgi:hypothetical protein
MDYEKRLDSKNRVHKMWSKLDKSINDRNISGIISKYQNKKNTHLNKSKGLFNRAASKPTITPSGGSSLKRIVLNKRRRKSPCPRTIDEGLEYQRKVEKSREYYMRKSPLRYDGASIDKGRGSPRGSQISNRLYNKQKIEKDSKRRKKGGAHSKDMTHQMNRSNDSMDARNYASRDIEVDKQVIEEHDVTNNTAFPQSPRSRI